LQFVADLFEKSGAPLPGVLRLTELGTKASQLAASFQCREAETTYKADHGRHGEQRSDQQKRLASRIPNQRDRNRRDREKGREKRDLPEKPRIVAQSHASCIVAPTRRKEGATVESRS
jgi:hypothetical protein